MKQKTYWVETVLRNCAPVIEAVSAKYAVSAHKAVYKKYGEQYLVSVILSNTPVSRLIYIASPYSGDIEANVQFAIQCCRYAIKRGYTPIAPHLLYPQMLNDAVSEERTLALTLGRTLLENCAEIWVCGERISSGMAGEIAYAGERNIRVRYIKKAEMGGTL